MLSRLLRLAALVLCFAPAAALAAPPEAKPPAALTTGLQEVQGAKLAADSTAELMAVLTTPSSPQAREGTAIALPVAGKLAGRDLPAHTFLVGTLRRIDEKSGVFHFEKLVLGTRVYEVEITSTPLAGQLKQDPQAMARAAQEMSREAMAMSSRQMEAIQAQQAASTGMGLLGGLLGMVPGVGMVAGIAQGVAGQAMAGAATAPAADMTKKMQALMDGVPKVLHVPIAPLQKLSLHIVKDVDLGAPVATLPAPLKPQGFVSDMPEVDATGLDEDVSSEEEPKKPGG